MAQLAPKGRAMSRTFAFRCVNCGHLEEAGQAGELPFPAACRYCSHGVHFDPLTGVKELEPENWEILAELPATHLKKIKDKHRLADHEIVRHIPHSPGEHRPPRHVQTTSEDVFVTEDKAEASK